MFEKLRPYAYWPAIIWAITLAFLMLLPQDTFPQSKLLSYDKLAHLAVFLIFSLLVLIGYTLKGKLKGKGTKQRNLTLTICLVYGVILEGLQQYVPGRMADIYDLLANFTGALFGVIVFMIFIKNKLAIPKLIL
ncbi:MAG: VanZ family protein [Roseivirga sp.]|uniref:VanZ family protein n=1 Tax=Roseivirga sp. TaxID=1964215 RepID=UPI001B15C9E1|nr:VanZ family protein [Roseivirga sp.]MBO6495144.1 VanZ family protein [Roseivirga sp.]